MSAAEDLAVRFHSVADDPTMTVRTDWGERVDCALEAVESTGDTLLNDSECLVVVVAAKITLGHDDFLCVNGHETHTPSVP